MLAIPFKLADRFAGNGHYAKSLPAYCSTSSKNLDSGNGDIWDTGKIQSGQSQYVHYDGKPLLSEKAYFWKVQIWDEQGKLSPWSNTASWRMGLLNASD